MIYADANATYPVAPKHLQDLLPMMIEAGGNPSSIHASGRSAKVAIEMARDTIAEFWGARAENIVFTSGATESNNIVLTNFISQTKNSEILISATEHPSIYNTAHDYQAQSKCSLKIIPVDQNGIVNTGKLQELISAATTFVSIIHINNETGNINDVIELAQLCKAQNENLHFHIDAVQSFTKIDLSNIQNSKVDSAAFSGHKIGALKGIGGLWLKKPKKFTQNTLIKGGKQESGIRAGTENVLGILSFATRCDEIKNYEDINKKSFWSDANLKAKRFAKALQEIPGAVIHSNINDISQTVNFHIEGISGEDIILNFDLNGIEVSSGSACSSGVNKPSNVLSAMGYDDNTALNSIRVSFTPDGSLIDIENMLLILKQTIERTKLQRKQDDSIITNK